MKKHDEIDFSKGEGYLVNGILVDAEGNPVKARGRRAAVGAAPSEDDKAIVASEPLDGGQVPKDEDA